MASQFVTLTRITPHVLLWMCGLVSTSTLLLHSQGCPAIATRWRRIESFRVLRCNNLSHFGTLRHGRKIPLALDTRSPVSPGLTAGDASRVESKEHVPAWDKTGRHWISGRVHLS